MLFYEEVFKALEENNIKYVVVGGLATVLHGVVRMTMDIDLIISMEKENVNKFISVAQKLGYLPKAPVSPNLLNNPEERKKWISEKNMKVFSFYNKKENYKIIDVFITEPIPFQLLEKQKKIIKADDFSIPVCSVEHLIALKKLAGRPQDMADIRMLKKLSNR